MGNVSSNTSTDACDEIRLVMIGKAGTGKSATGNTILNKEAFVSKLSASSTTKSCRRGENICERQNKKYNLVVVDTPGLFDTVTSNEEISKEIAKCIGISSPGPHAILYIISLANRFTDEEQATAMHFIDLFGENLRKFMLIIFTYGDNLQKDDNIEQMILEAPQPLQELIKTCGNRYVVVDNKTSSKETKKNQLNTLFTIIEGLTVDNDQKFYTDAMYRKTEETLQIRMKEMKKTDEKMAPVDLRSSVRNEVEEQKKVLTSIGQGIYSVGKEKITAGLPRKEELKKIEEEMAPVDLRSSVKDEDEEDKKVLSSIGQGILSVGKEIVTAGLPRLISGLASWLGI